MNPKITFAVACLALLLTGANLSFSIVRNLKERTERQIGSTQVSQQLTTVVVPTIPATPEKSAAPVSIPEKKTMTVYYCSDTKCIPANTPAGPKQLAWIRRLKTIDHEIYRTSK
jgi:hypothetical protein